MSQVNCKNCPYNILDEYLEARCDCPDECPSYEAQVKMWEILQAEAAQNIRDIKVITGDY